MAQPNPSFTLQTAHQKVKVAQALWNTRSPSRVAQAYTPTSIWRNRGTFLRGHAEIQDFLTKKWGKEKEYRLRKELFAHQENRIAVQFWYEYRDAHDFMIWKRCYGIEHWTFAADGKMEKRMMSGNDVVIGEQGRWFKDGVDIDSVTLGEKDF
ncbi:MAG: hypothetical protein ASARMPRED_005193 [Alectoria sarmentosa]|nr:MAG: hypothetical protein ASARMPRED_005193 [Alectoria sarmentosa]